MSRIRTYDLDSATLADGLSMLIDDSSFDEAQKATLSELFTFLMGKMSGDADSIGEVTISSAGVVKVGPFEEDKSTDPVFYDDAADPSGSDEIKFGGQITASKIGSIGDGESDSGWVAGDKAKVFYNASTGTYGFAVKLQNETGSASVLGEAVTIDTATAESFILSTGATDVIGFVLDTGVADGEETWIQINGVATVLLEDDEAAVKGYYCIKSSVDGRVKSTASYSAANAGEYIGMFTTANAGGTGQTAKIVMFTK